MPDAAVARRREELALRGFVISRGILDRAALDPLVSDLRDTYERLRDEHGDPGNVLAISRHMVEELGFGDRITALYREAALLDFMEELLGPDMAMIPFINLWIGDPGDQSAVTTKPLHQEFWSGGGLEDLSVWLPLTGPDPTNTLCVVPGSHLYGVVPNRNRVTQLPDNVELPPAEPLADVAPGDVVAFHSLLLHASGSQKETLRFSASAVLKPLFAETSRKNASLGQVPLRVGPLTRIRQMLGNDLLTPFRTLGGAVSNKPAALEDKS